MTERFSISQASRLFVVTGFLGGYTTFSSFGYETWRLFLLDGWWPAGLNFLGNIILGAIGILLEVIVAHSIPD